MSCAGKYFSSPPAQALQTSNSRRVKGRASTICRLDHPTAWRLDPLGCHGKESYPPRAASRGSRERASHRDNPRHCHFCRESILTCPTKCLFLSPPKQPNLSFSGIVLDRSSPPDLLCGIVVGCRGLSEVPEAQPDLSFSGRTQS